MLQLWCAKGDVKQDTPGEANSGNMWEYHGPRFLTTAQVESAKAWGVDYRRLGCSMVGSPSVQVLSSLLLVYQSSVIKYHGFTMEHDHYLHTYVTDNNVHQISFGIIIL